MIRRWIEQNSSLNVTFLHNGQNLGVCKTLNRALSIAHGKYISMIATDDVWEAEKLTQQVQAIESLPEKTGVLYSDAFQIDESGSPLPKPFIESHREFNRMPEGDIREILWEGNFIPAMTTLIRRSVFERVGMYDESLFYEDWEMWLRISEHYHFAYFPRPIAKYRIVRNSISKSSVDKMTLANELIFIKYLLKKGVPSKLRNQGFNFAVRRAYRRERLHGMLRENCFLDWPASIRVRGWSMPVCFIRAAWNIGTTRRLSAGQRESANSFKRGF
jgi:GT2 family glycosyltransferase